MSNEQTMDYLDHFRRIYTPTAGESFGHVTTITHEGHMIVFVADGRYIKYAVLGATDQVQQDCDAWPDDLSTLAFPTELQFAGQEAIGNFVMPIVVGSQEFEPGKLPIDDEFEVDPVLSSTARLGWNTPFQALSTDLYVYVFRQSIPADDPRNVKFKLNQPQSRIATSVSYDRAVVDNTLLVDRFVLVDAGERMELIRPREARYQRSRNKSLPAGRTDTLDQNDLEGKPFFEPTVALTMIDRIGEGGFCVMTLPTANGSSRWQFFVNRKRSDSIESFNIARSESGWFDFQGARYYTSPDDAYRASVLERRP